METVEQIAIETIAKVCHEVCRAYCFSIGDGSQVPWDAAPDWQKKTVIAGVNAAIQNPEQTPQMSHEGWLRCKRADGWGWGTIKDAEKKTHPCIVEYDELPEAQKTKDLLFIAVVRAMDG